MLDWQQKIEKDDLKNAELDRDIKQKIKQKTASEFEKVIGYEFQRKDLLEGALKHTSIRGAMFEFLEFVGDRVLGLVISTLLIEESHMMDLNSSIKAKAEKQSKDGRQIKDLANTYAKLVSTKMLVEIGRAWKLQNHLKHNIQVLSDKVYADAVESIIGAIYLDSGFEKAREFIYTWWQKFLSISTNLEPKMQLQEFAQSKGLGVPIYETTNVTGPDHMRIYTIKVSVAGFCDAIANGSSKHEASKNAAVEMLKNIAKSKERKISNACDDLENIFKQT